MDSVKTVGEWSLQYTPPPSEWFYSHNASAILCPSAKGGERTILDMRGWGYLTGKGHGALGLDSETAAREQDALALFIIDACKVAAPPAGAEVVAPRSFDWLCEEHPDQPMGHDGCGGAGIPSDTALSFCANQLRHARQELKEHKEQAELYTPSTDAVRRQAREELARELGELASEVGFLDITSIWEVATRPLPRTPPASSGGGDEG